MEILAIVSIVLWIVTIVGYIIFNLYKKNKKMEEQIIKQINYINNFMLVSSEIDELVNKIDNTMWVQSDPELLSLFESMKELKDLFKQYRQEND